MKPIADGMQVLILKTLFIDLSPSEQAIPPATFIRMICMKVSTLRNGIRRFGKLSFSDKALVIETASYLSLARMITRFMPARYWLRWLHTESEPEMRGEPLAAHGKDIGRSLPVIAQQLATKGAGLSSSNAEKAETGSLDPILPRKVGNAVGKVARYLPFDSRCLHQAMAVQWMLRHRRVDSVLVFGVRRNIISNHDLQYHAWLTVDGIPVIGGEEVESYEAFPTFSSSWNK